jgi:hypothetical protein
MRLATNHCSRGCEVCNVYYIRINRYAICIANVLSMFCIGIQYVLNMYAAAYLVVLDWQRTLEVRSVHMLFTLSSSPVMLTPLAQTTRNSKRNLPINTLSICSVSSRSTRCCSPVITALLCLLVGTSLRDRQP